MILIPIYLLAINLVAFTAMGLDKRKAEQHKWRIPEIRLFLYVILGGGIGGTLGMSMFRHKTKHWYFKLFFPLIAIVEYAAIIFIIIKFFPNILDLI